MSFGGPGITTFVDSLTNPGPDTTGELAVMLNQKAFDQWLANEMRKDGRKRCRQKANVVVRRRLTGKWSNGVSPSHGSERRYYGRRCWVERASPA